MAKHSTNIHIDLPMSKDRALELVSEYEEKYHNVSLVYHDRYWAGEGEKQSSAEIRASNPRKKRFSFVLSEVD